MKLFAYEVVIVVFILGFGIPVQAEEASLKGNSETAVVVTVKESQADVPHPNEVICNKQISYNARGHPQLLPQTNEVKSSIVPLGVTISVFALMLIIFKRKRKNNE